VCHLENTSLVSMAFNLRVEGDDIAAAAATATTEENKSIIASPLLTIQSSFNEFSIVPNSGVLPPQSRCKLIVEFVPHFIKKYDTFLLVDVDDVGVELMRLPISARSSVPALSLSTPRVDMGRCFIYYAYERVIQISNESSLRARYRLVPSRHDDPLKFASKLDEVDTNTIFIFKFSFNE
jgi:hydrocephalus-inducing protein